MTLPRQRPLGGRLPRRGVAVLLGLLPATALVAGPGPSLGTQVLPPAAAVTAASVAGQAGFAGRVIPHVLRLIAGADDARIVPMSALPGAARLVVIDTIARIALAPVGIATGLMTAIIGAPVFLWLVRTRA